MARRLGVVLALAAVVLRRRGRSHGNQIRAGPKSPPNGKGRSRLPKQVNVRPGAACGDPRFIGGDGNAFYFHGRKDADFCVVSDRDLHINAHFIGKSGHSGMSRDFTWIQAIAVLFDGHHLYVGARKTGTWDDAVEHLEITPTASPCTSRLTRSTRQNDVQPCPRVVRDPHQGTTACSSPLTGAQCQGQSPCPSIERLMLHRRVASDDCFCSPRRPSSSTRSPGRRPICCRPDVPVRLRQQARRSGLHAHHGGDTSFTASSLFAADCAVARFEPSVATTKPVMSELAGITCASGMDGQGVCTRSKHASGMEVDATCRLPRVAHAGPLPGYDGSPRAGLRVQSLAGHWLSAVGRRGRLSAYAVYTDGATSPRVAAPRVWPRRPFRRRQGTIALPTVRPLAQLQPSRAPVGATWHTARLPRMACMPTAWPRRSRMAHAGRVGDGRGRWRRQLGLYAEGQPPRVCLIHAAMPRGHAGTVDSPATPRATPSA
ncbi:hypothetical protein QYE76_002998 [Lolium multiflorum]|uniref:Uncharacterized protein n=1 Tax=Lolium multiflorum TaxID=4521 RepID=A0AAD8W0W0_LOLMU|nr:hypothetical protein QYE76_002998 [Lolium multiflorum]